MGSMCISVVRTWQALIQVQVYAVYLWSNNQKRCPRRIRVLLQISLFTILNIPNINNLKFTLRLAQWMDGNRISHLNCSLSYMVFHFHFTTTFSLFGHLIQQLSFAICRHNEQKERRMSDFNHPPESYLLSSNFSSLKFCVINFKLGIVFNNLAQATFVHFCCYQRCLELRIRFHVIFFVYYESVFPPDALKWMVISLENRSQRWRQW